MLQADHKEGDDGVLTTILERKLLKSMVGVVDCCSRRSSHFLMTLYIFEKEINVHKMLFLLFVYQNIIEKKTLHIMHFAVLLFVK